MDETHPHLQHEGDHHHMHKAGPDDLGEHLRSMGYRMTPQRRLIMEIIQSSSQRLSAQAIFQKVREKSDQVDQATVYRTVELFQKIGLIYSAQEDGQTVYELAAQVPHHHLVCRKCGAIQHLGDHHFQHLIEHLLKDHHFKAEISHLTLNGLCSNCV